ncbi:cell division protein ZapE [Salinibius halmophilus]|uniref:cell division protein ZapE n=1 Tax=Salinibius halmophilus TaxID=1853216 RepID=UPI000E65EE88|nr:cell division protein ZapE [Salinibius halmophilus]
MTPLAAYENDLNKQGFIADAAQKEAVMALNDLYHRLLDDGGPTMFQKLLRKKVVPPRGLYFWGGVGRGKTYLMDTFYECLPFDNKRRVHFHRFMQMVHARLSELAGEKNPLDKVAQEWASNTRVLCFDEFFVSDIGDAMILANLVGGLFERGVALVATSNIEPQGLYKDGLQRDRFLPAIRMIEQYCDVLNVDGGTDYRLRQLEQAELYHYPLDDAAKTSLQSSFDNLIPGHSDIKINEPVEVLGRKLVALQVADDVAWFDFLVLCDGPRSQNDYIELGRLFHTVLVQNVPKFTAEKDDQARRFINLVDEFYDRGVKLIITAEVSLAHLYESGKLSFEFERTQSRLLEMQSHEYLAREHKA